MVISKDLKESSNGSVLLLLRHRFLQLYTMTCPRMKPLQRLRPKWRPGRRNMSHFQHTTRLSRSIRGEIRSRPSGWQWARLPWHRPKQKYISGRGRWSLRNTVRKPQKHARKAPAPNHGGTGFLTLPPELRNKVYRLLFIARKDLVFYFPSNFCLSSAFLRTCRQIHEEGCGILYGENTFVFERNKYTRAPLWSPSLKGIGYKDMRLFLKLIGPRNLSMARDIQLVFEDAMPSSTPYLHNQEARRFASNEHLIGCMYVLDSQSELREISVFPRPKVPSSGCRHSIS